MTQPGKSVFTYDSPGCEVLLKHEQWELFGSIDYSCGTKNVRFRNL